MSVANKMTTSPNPQPESWEDVTKLVTMAQESEAYLKFLGLKHNPFPVAPDADVFFLPARIDALITEILHCIYTRKGFLVITGEVGLGKTTVSRRIMRTLDETQVETALIFNTFIQGSALLEEINRDFGIEYPGSGPQEQMGALNRFLIDRYAAGINCAIVIDDAQNLTEESLEMVRMISNLEAHAQKLVQILLVGQPELELKLNVHALRQLKSRIVVHARMQPYSSEELKQYIGFKLNAAGSSGGVTIPDGSYRFLHELTQGNPRRVNNLMDRCLYGLFAYNTMRLTRRVIQEVAKELGLRPPKKNWGGLLKKGGVLLGVAAVVALMVFGKGIYQSISQHQGVSLVDGDGVEFRLVKEQAAAELARAKSERERAFLELAQAESAKAAVSMELAKSRTESERAKEMVARAQVAEAKALTQVANAKEVSQAEAVQRKQALTEAREAREAAEAAAARSELALNEFRQKAEAQVQALAAADAATNKAEAEALAISQKLARLQAESAAQAQALVQATQVRKEAESRADVARQEAEKARQDAELRAVSSQEEKKILAQAQTARQQAEQEAVKARQEANEAFKRIEKVRQEAEQAMATEKANAEARLIQAEAAQKAAEMQARKNQEDAAQILAQVEAEQAKREAELLKSKTQADRDLTLALAAQSRAELEAKQARQEAARVVDAIQQAKDLDQVGKDQALSQAKADQVEAEKLRTAQVDRVGLQVEKAREAAKKQQLAMETLQQARQQAEAEAAKAQEQAEKSLSEAQLIREQAAQDVKLAQMDAEKAKQELLIARQQMATMVARQSPEGVVAASLVPVSSHLQQFLHAYDLEAFEQEMAQGLADGWLDGVARRIEEEKGLHLVYLEHLPDTVKEKYSHLPQGKGHLLFWKPEFSFKTFYYAHSGAEVRLLQSHLHRLGLYDFPIDGVVGRHTMSALTQYQNLRNLPLTGQPDEATLFLLTHEQGGKSPSTREIAPKEKKVFKEKGGSKDQSSSLGGAITLMGGGHWVVQLGSFLGVDGAEALQHNLIAKGVATSVVSLLTPDGSRWHIVRTLPVDERSQAEKMLADLESKFGLQGMIIPVESGLSQITPQ